METLTDEGVSADPEANRIEELEHFKELLERGLVAAQQIADPERRKKIYDRVNS